MIRAYPSISLFIYIFIFIYMYVYRIKLELSALGKNYHVTECSLNAL